MRRSKKGHDSWQISIQKAHKHLEKNKDSEVGWYHKKQCLDSVAQEKEKRRALRIREKSEVKCSLESFLIAVVKTREREAWILYPVN